MKKLFIVLFIILALFLVSCNQSKNFENLITDYFHYVNSENWDLAKKIAHDEPILFAQKTIESNPHGTVKFTLNDLYETKIGNEFASAKVNYSISLYSLGNEVDKINKTSTVIFKKGLSDKKWKIDIF